MGSYHFNTIFNHFRNGSNKPQIFRMELSSKSCYLIELVKDEPFVLFNTALISFKALWAPYE